MHCTVHALKKEIATPVFALARNDRGCDEVHSKDDTERVREVTNR